MNPDDLCARVVPLLRRALGETVDLRKLERIKDGCRCEVFRCTVSAPSMGIDSVILKRKKLVPEAERAFTDWASLSFLTHLPGIRGIAPRFYGGDPVAGIYAIEDLGDSQSLEDVLMGRDPAALQKTLRALAIQSARLHAQTMGREEMFMRTCRSLPDTGVPGRRQEAERWLGGRAKLEDWLDALQCPRPTGFQASLERVAGLFAEPGPFLAFTHGDPAPTNNHVAGDDVRLLDFEFGGFRHALYDLTAWYVLCPLPEGQVEKMTRVYRAELATRCSAAADDTLYREGWSHLCAYRALAILTWLPPDLLVHDRPWAGGRWSGREAVLAAISRLRLATADVAGLAPLSDAAAILGEALRVRWPDLGDGLPRWPALPSGAS
jgi:hypothetical protein